MRSPDEQVRRTAAPDREETDDVLAHVTWSALAEPGDPVAGLLVAAMGAGPALRWLSRFVDEGSPGRHGGLPHLAGPGRAGPHLVEREADRTVERAAGRTVEQRSERKAERGAGQVPDDDTWVSAVGRARLLRAVERWLPRLEGYDPRRDLDAVRELGGDVLVPADPRWPRSLDALGVAAPPCLWVRGESDLDRALRRSVSVVGARAATSYGEHVARDIAAGLVADEVTVVSGGAYGIDAAAHRGTLVADGTAVAVMAGGPDRLYPAGNQRMLTALLAEGGAVVSEVPPGRLPTKSRFLQRNRLIAAMSAVTVVVEAAWRSGALSTAHHAARLLRPVGAVPGPVTSMASAGCHRLLREGVAVCVTDTADVLELGGLLRDGSEAPGGPTGEHDGPPEEQDETAARVLDAMPRRSAADESRIAREAGLGLHETRAALGLLELDGRVERHTAGWRLRMHRAARDRGGPTR